MSVQKYLLQTFFNIIHLHFFRIWLKLFKFHFQYFKNWKICYFLSLFSNKNSFCFFKPKAAENPSPDNFRIKITNECDHFSSAPKFPTSNQPILILIAFPPRNEIPPPQSFRAAPTPKKFKFIQHLAQIRRDFFTSTRFFSRNRDSP